jgi:RNA polymerase sigma-70 factor, ECF subfamily
MVGSDGRMSDRDQTQRAPADPSDVADDRDLVSRLRTGDDAAYESLVRTQGPRMLAVARRYLPQEADAQDTVQEAFVLVFRSIDRFAGDSRLSTWIHRIVVNCALMRIRARSRRPEESLDEPVLDAVAAGVPGSDGGEGAGLAREEILAHVRACLDRLPDPYRAVLRLRDVEGLELREIATLLNLGLSTVKNRVHRGRHALREMLGSAFDEVSR